jgi:hypothetical protein
MKKEDRELLLRDLSARFPYNVALDCRDEVSRFTCYLTSDMLREIQNNTYYWEYKPYLYPLSSMTEEQKREYQYIKERWMYDSSYSISDSIDWLNKNHFDYRGLIEKGLAIDATGLNIY